MTYVVRVAGNLCGPFHSLLKADGWADDVRAQQGKGDRFRPPPDAVTVLEVFHPMETPYGVPFTNQQQA